MRSYRGQVLRVSAKPCISVANVVKFGGSDKFYVVSDITLSKKRIKLHLTCVLSGEKVTIGLVEDLIKVCESINDLTT